MPFDFESLLKSATERIGADYFQLSVAGSAMAYRERLYCYELYHLLRTLWPEHCEYQLGGEIDKQGHRLIESNVKPDLLVHVPGSMGNNHTIIEVKPIRADKDGIKKDLKTLTAFRNDARYRNAIYLIYGDGDISRVKFAIENHAEQAINNEIDLSLIDVWWHKKVSKAAERLEL